MTDDTRIPGHGHPTTEPSGASRQPGRDVEDHTRQDGERVADDAERSRNVNRVDRDSDRRGAGDRSNDPSREGVDGQDNYSSRHPDNARGHEQTGGGNSGAGRSGAEGLGSEKSGDGLGSEKPR